MTISQLLIARDGVFTSTFTSYIRKQLVYVTAHKVGELTFTMLAYFKLVYPLKCASNGTASAQFSGYLNSKSLQNNT